MPQVSFHQAPVELPKTHGGHVGVFIAGAADRVENANSGQERDGFARCREQLFDRFLMVARFSEYLVVANGQLVGADDKCLPRIDGNGLGFFAREVGRQLRRLESLIVGFVYIRGYRSRNYRGNRSSSPRR